MAPTDPRRNGPFGTRFRVLRNPESRQDHTRRKDPEAGLLTILPRPSWRPLPNCCLEERRIRQGQVHELIPGHGPVWEARR